MRSLPEIPAGGASSAIVDLGALMDIHQTNIDQDIAVGRDARIGVELTEEKVVSHLGESAQTIFPNLFGKNRAWEELRDIFLEYNKQFPRKLYPEVIPFLDKLDDWDTPVGLVTVTSRTTFDRHILDHNQPLSPDYILGKFAVTRFAEDINDPLNEPHPYRQLLAQALGESSLHGAVVVGSELSNLEAASSHGLPFIGVTSRLATKADFQACGARYIVNGLPAAQDLLLGQAHSG